MLNVPRTPRRAAAHPAHAGRAGRGRGSSAGSRRGPTPCETAQMWVLDAVSAPAGLVGDQGAGIDRRRDRQRGQPGRIRPGRLGHHRPRPDWGAHSADQPELGGARDLDGLADRRARARGRGQRHHGRGPGLQDPLDPGGDRPARPGILRLRARVRTAGSRTRWPRPSRSRSGTGPTWIRHVAGLSASPSTVGPVRLAGCSRPRIVVVASVRQLRQLANVGHAGQAPYSFPADYPGGTGRGAVSRSGFKQPASPSDNLSVQVAAPGSTCRPRAGTASTGWSAGPARPVRLTAGRRRR